MPRITLTDLTDVIAKSGTPKATKVAQLKHRQDYSPAIDFYKPLREGLVRIHKVDGSKADLANISRGLADAKKAANYPAMLDGYRKWWGRKRLTWFEPTGDVYSCAGIDVSVHPELGLVVNGKAHVIKLHLKSDPLSKTRADLVVTLMHHVLAASHQDDVQFAVLDVRNGKLFSFSSARMDFQPMVNAELAYISSLWPQV